LLAELRGEAAGLRLFPGGALRAPAGALILLRLLTLLPRLQPLALLLRILESAQVLLLRTIEAAAVALEGFKTVELALRVPLAAFVALRVTLLAVERAQLSPLRAAHIALAQPLLQLLSALLSGLPRGGGLLPGRFRSRLLRPNLLLSILLPGFLTLLAALLPRHILHLLTLLAS
jgi:hypothetical protein